MELTTRHNTPSPLTHTGRQNHHTTPHPTGNRWLQNLKKQKENQLEARSFVSDKQQRHFRAEYVAQVDIHCRTCSLVPVGACASLISSARWQRPLWPKHSEQKLQLLRYHAITMSTNQPTNMRAYTCVLLRNIFVVYPVVSWCSVDDVRNSNQPWVNYRFFQTSAVDPVIS